MAIAFDSSNSTSCGGCNSLSYSHTVASGAVLVAFINDRQADDFDSITYDGVSPDLTFTHNNDAFWRGFVWKNPSSGTNTLSVSFTGSGRQGLASASYTGVDNSDPVGATELSETYDGSTSYSFSFTTSFDNSWPVSHITTSGGETVTAAGSMVGREESIGPGSNFTSGMGDRTTTSAGSYSIDWSFSGGASGGSAHGILELVEDGARGPGFTPITTGIF